MKGSTRRELQPTASPGRSRTLHRSRRRDRGALRSYLLPLAIVVSTLTAAAPGGAQIPAWQTAGLEGGWVRSLAVAPSDSGRVYVATAGGLFRSTDGGRSWTLSDTGVNGADFLNVVAVSPASADTLWVGTGLRQEPSAGAFLGGLFKSTDGGRTWTSSSSGLGEFLDLPAVRGLVADPEEPQHLVAATSSGLFTSADGGATWQAAEGPIVDTHAVSSSAADPEVVYAATDAGVWSSADGGRSWVSVSAGLPSSRVSSIAVDPTGSETVFAGTDKGLARSGDGGASWTAIALAPGTEDAAITALAVGAAGARVYAAAGAHGLFRSLDGGASWEPVLQGLPAGVAITTLSVDPTEPATVFAGSAVLGVFRSRNGGGVWQPLRSGLTATNVHALALDPEAPDAPWAGTAAGVFRRLATKDWEVRNTGLLDGLGRPPEVRDLERSPDGSLLAATNGGVFRSQDGGVTWERRSDGLDDFFGPAPVDDLEIDPAQPDILYAAGRSGVFKSGDGGGSWQPASDGIAGLFGATAVTSLAVDPLHPATLYAGGFGALFKSDDRAASWRRSDRGLGGGIFGSFFGVDAIRVDPAHPEVLYAATSSGAYRSRDGAETWAPINHGIGPLSGILTQPVFDLAIDPTDSSVLFASSFDGVFRSTNGGDDWLPAGLERTTIRAFAFGASGASGASGAGGAGSGGGLDLWAGSRASGVFSYAPIEAEPLSLAGGRFRATVVWRDPAGHMGAGRPISLTTDTGAFWFFQQDTVELLVKILDGRPINGHFWVFYGALSNVEYTITVTDTDTGTSKSYVNPAGTIASNADTEAFEDDGGSQLGAGGEADVREHFRALALAEAAADLAAAASSRAGIEVGSRASTVALSGDAQTAGCTTTDDALCLLGQFEVRVDWQDFGANSGHGVAIDLSEDTGLFWFFDDANIELAVKVLDGRAINGHVWVFFGSLSNVAFTITVTDTATGAERRYANPLGTFGSRADTAAFD